MLSTPQLTDRAAQPYVAIAARVTMQSMMAALPVLWPEVAAWLAERGIAPSGAPLIRWVVIDMPGEMLIEVGMPVAEEVPGDARVIAGHLPAGRYVVAVHSGHYDELVAAHAALQDWGANEKVAWAVEPTPDGDAWAARIESYTTDPAAVSNPADWRTEIAYLVALGEPTPRTTRKPKGPAAKAKRRAPKKAAKRTKRAATKPKRAARKAKRAPANAKRRATKKTKRPATKKTKRPAAKKAKRSATKTKRRAPKR